MSEGLGALSKAWVTVEASMALGWRLMVLVRQPDCDDWQATAAGPLDGQVQQMRQTMQGEQIFSGDLSARATVCTNCGKPVGSEKFCSSCGTPTGQNKCTNCGTELVVTPA
jgi:ribosomal protein L32